MAVSPWQTTLAEVQVSFTQLKRIIRFNRLPPWSCENHTKANEFQDRISRLCPDPERGVVYLFGRVTHCPQCDKSGPFNVLYSMDVRDGTFSVAVSWSNKSCQIVARQITI